MGVATQQVQTHHRARTSTVRPIPAFGNWECSYYSSSGGDGEDGGGIPITEYFESARADVLGRREEQKQQMYPSSLHKGRLHRQGCCHHGHQLQLYPRTYRYHDNSTGKQGASVVWTNRRQSEERPLTVRPQPQRRRHNHCNHDQQHQDAAATVRNRGGPTTERLTPRLTPAAGGKKMAAVRPPSTRAPKAVDEDLYKIPTELLRLHQRTTATTRRTRTIPRGWRCIGIHCVE